MASEVEICSTESFDNIKELHELVFYKFSCAMLISAFTVSVDYSEQTPPKVGARTRMKFQQR